MIKRQIKNEEMLGKSTGLYSQGILYNDLIFTTQIGNVKGGGLVAEDMYSQTIQTLQNASYILETQGASMENILKCTIYITDMNDYDEMNRAYEELMPKPYPARACIQVSQLSPGSKVEMEFVAHKS